MSLKLKIIIIFSFIVLKAALPQWYQIQTDITGSLNWFHFINPNTGFAAGYHVLARTTNGGINWIVNQEITQCNLHRIYFINPTTGFTFNIDTVNASIFRTTNGGMNWHNVNAPTFKYARSILFLNSQIGFIFGQKVSILKTTNGGNNWFYNPASSGDSLGDVRGSARVNDSTIVAVGTWKQYYSMPNYRAIYYSNNFGSTFTKTVINENNFLNDVAFNQSGIGIIGGNGYMGRSTNYGLNWVEIQTYYNEGHSICWSNENTVYRASSGGHIDNSTDAGLTWIQQFTGINNEPILCINMLNVNTGFALGNYGKIYKTTNGGSTPIKKISTEIPDKLSLSQNYPNPFNPSTNIKYQITNNKLVTLKVFNILGKEVVTLVNEKLQPGTYEIKFEGTNLPSGVYYYKIICGDFSETRKMVLIK